MKHATTVILGGLLALGSGMALAKTKAGPAVVKRGTMTDKRNGTIYNTVTIGRQKWMAENLNYPLGSSWCYEGKAENCEKDGQLYDWATAKRVCPQGWHLPSDDEWSQLEAAVGEPASTRLRSSTGWKDDGNGADAYGFSVLPVGLRTIDGLFIDIGSHACFWSATESEARYAWARFFHSGAADVYRSSGNKIGGFSVRCLEN
ncbi:MAG: hypothetical protein RL318_381 [Fibrobacterota bacterium]|jgi:uncharacterized protein (TIGR02145 family)